MIYAVALAHFLASFTALGMPPFFALLTERAFQIDAQYLTGWLYIVPTICLALCSRWWGRIADRVGKKSMLLRAQLGLALSFLMAGFADSIQMFVLALMMQGVFGGAFSAANAYLAGITEGYRLSRGLTMMQGAARAALLLAPPVLGWVMSAWTSLEVYRYLALLPLLAAGIVSRLPEEGHSSGMRQRVKPQAITEATPSINYKRLLLCQFVFTYATVVSFPYYVPYVIAVFPGIDTAVAGLLFGLPHLVYLLAASSLQSRYGKTPGQLTLAGGFLGLAVVQFGQHSLIGCVDLVLWRLLMGLAMTFCFVQLHAAMAHSIPTGQAGHRFGSYESSAKWATVLAGVSAGFSVQWFDLHTPFLLGAASLVSCAVYLIYFGRSRCNTAELY